LTNKKLCAIIKASSRERAQKNFYIPKGKKTMENRFSDIDHGAFGKATEESVKAFLHLKVGVSKAGRTDLRKANICYEVKTGAGELGLVGGKLVKGSTMVIYIPVVDETAEIYEQEGFVMSRELFLETLDGCGLIREKTSTSGIRKVTIQTFWNRKLNKPHGKGYQRMLDAFYALEGNGVQTLEEWLEQWA
jgi:hypothetical protein